MYVCVCNAVTDRDIHRAVDEGAREFGELQMRTGCATTCGCCETLARQVLDEAAGTLATPPLVLAPA